LRSIKDEIRLDQPIGTANAAWDDLAGSVEKLLGLTEFGGHDYSFNR
jgi:hypothetical protein